MKTIAIAVAGLLVGVAPAAFGQQGPGYPPPQENGAYGQPTSGYQDRAGPGDGYRAGQAEDPDRAAGPSWQGGQPDDENVREAQRYGQAEDAYRQQMREYRRQRREYERQRAAYDAQFGGATSETYPPPPAPPPEPPPPVAGADGWRHEAAGSWRYGQTSPFRDGPWTADRGAGWYRDHGCRLAAPERGDDQMIPVCPDVEGLYRPAG